MGHIAKRNSFMPFSKMLVKIESLGRREMGRNASRGRFMPFFLEILVLSENNQPQSTGDGLQGNVVSFLSQW